MYNQTLLRQNYILFLLFISELQNKFYQVYTNFFKLVFYKLKLFLHLSIKIGTVKNNVIVFAIIIG